MEIKIGVQQTAREIVLECAEGQDEISKKVSAAIKDGGVLELEDEKGRRVLVPAEKIAFVEMGVSSTRKVGFGNA